jgi:hypothetical protein
VDGVNVDDIVANVIFDVGEIEGTFNVYWIDGANVNDIVGTYVIVKVGEIVGTRLSTRVIDSIVGSLEGAE